MLHRDILIHIELDLICHILTGTSKLMERNKGLLSQEIKWLWRKALYMERHGPVGGGPEEGHENDERDGKTLL